VRAYRDVGPRDADGEALFDSAAAINAELDRYLAHEPERRNFNIPFLHKELPRPRVIYGRTGVTRRPRGAGS